MTFSQDTQEHSLLLLGNFKKKRVKSSTTLADYLRVRFLLMIKSRFSVRVQTRVLARGLPELVATRKPAAVHRRHQHSMQEKRARHPLSRQLSKKVQGKLRHFHPHAGCPDDIYRSRAMNIPTRVYSKHTRLHNNNSRSKPKQKRDLPGTSPATVNYTIFPRVMPVTRAQLLQHVQRRRQTQNNTVQIL